MVLRQANERETRESKVKGCCNQHLQSAQLSSLKLRLPILAAHDLEEHLMHEAGH